MNTFDRIKELCEKQGITIAELEREAKVGNGTIRRWGTTLPSGDKLQKVADYLKTTVDYLINGALLDTDIDIRRIERARKKMTPKDKERMMKILEASFEDYFDDEH